MKLASTAKRPRLLQLKNVYEILKFLAVVKQKAESITPCIYQLISAFKGFVKTVKTIDVIHLLLVI